MKSTPLIINWHESNAPIYSADFQKGDKARLATGGGDNNVRVRITPPSHLNDILTPNTALEIGLGRRGSNHQLPSHVIEA